VSRNTENDVKIIHFLRAIAVLAVVLFHAGIPYFSKGWLGVDVFLVISGFLMQMLYSKSLHRGLVRDFYRRRAERLLPAFLFTQILSFAIFFSVGLPFERKIFSEQFISGLLASSNTRDWLSTNYFSSNELNPTLNFWSLALELQFYLLFPVIIKMINNSNARLFVLTLSFGFFAAVLSIVSPPSAFYLISGRIWEFLIGATAFEVTRSRAIHKLLNLWRATLYFVMILIFICAVWIENYFTAQLLTTFLTLLILVFFKDLEPSHRMVYKATTIISKYSYEIYLIHLPILVFLTYKPFSGNLNLAMTGPSLLIAFVSITLSAVLIYHFVEFMKFKMRVSKFIFSLIILSLFLSIPPYFSGQVRNLGFSDSQITVTSAIEDRGTFRCGLLYRVPILHRVSDTCPVGRYVEGRENVLLMGNSHADMLKLTIAKVLDAENLNLRLLAENDPISKDNQGVYISAIKNQKYKAVVLSNRYGSASIESVELLARDLKKMKIPFFIILPIAEAPFNVPEKMYLDLWSGGDISLTSRLTISQVNDMYSDELLALRSIKEKYSVELIDLNSVLCQVHCLIADVRSRKPIYFDDNHLTLSGASMMYQVLHKSLANLRLSDE
jgi:peptidoglycan/LPS O-acetylase OafA/YrhL